MARFTIRDSEKTVSFAGEARLAPYLIAACATEPATLEDLLLAVEQYRGGTTARVMHGLLAFDATLCGGEESSTEAGDTETPPGQPTTPAESTRPGAGARDDSPTPDVSPARPGPLPKGDPAAGRRPVPMGVASTVEVVDARTARLAAAPDHEGLLRIDLQTRHISGWVVTAEPIAVRGTLDLPAPVAGQYTVAYALGDGWTVALETVIDGDETRQGASHA